MKYIKKNPDFEGINDETVKKLKKYAKVAKNKSEPER